MKFPQIKTFLLVTASFTASYCTPAFAQNGTAAPRTREDPADQDIIVTARRIEERLQDVPISITAFNQGQLLNRNIVAASELATYTPSLTSDTRFGSNNATFAIRGFTQEARTTSSVAVYFADVVAPRGGNGGIGAGDGAGPGSFFDLQNVQVLKGPQGTLFGRNTTGGAVLLVPQKPTSKLEGYLEGTYGNYNMERVQGVINVPLSDIARLRVGFDQQKRDGYLKNISGVGASDYNDVSYFAARASLDVDLTPNLENYILASYLKSDTNGPIDSISRCNPAKFPFGTIACGQVARKVGTGFYSVEGNMPNPRSLVRQWQVINTTTWRASDALTIKNIVSYAELNNLLRSDIFGLNFVIPTQLGPIPNTGPFAGKTFPFANSTNANNLLTSNQSTFTEELQFQGHAMDNKLSWQAGAYLELSDPLGATGAQSPVLLSCTNSATYTCTDVVAALLRQPSIGSINYAAGKVSFRNMAAYGQATYALADNLKITGGIRYTSDRTTASAQQVTYRFFTPNVPSGFCTLSGVATTSPANCGTRNVQNSKAPTWLVDIDYNPVQDILLYAKYSRGYRQGAVNYSAPVEYQTYGPEKLDAYEVGVKTSFNGFLHGTFNVAGFYNDFTNQQLAVNVISSTSAVSPSTVVVNGGKSRIYGLEVDTSLRLFQGFSLDASYAYLNTKLVSLVPVVPTPGSPYDLFTYTAIPGSRLAQTPTHKLSVTGTYRLPLAESAGRLSIAATYSYYSSVLYTQSIAGTLPAVGLLNLNLNWNAIGGTQFDASVFATNVTKKHYYTYPVDQFAGLGFVTNAVGQPRFFGVRLRYHFGQ